MKTRGELLEDLCEELAIYAAHKDQYKHYQLTAQEFMYRFSQRELDEPGHIDRELSKYCKKLATRANKSLLKKAMGVE